MYKSLQVCRAIAGMLVVLYHLGGAFGADKYFGVKTLAAIMALGHHSVVFFFVLSGFILVRAHHEDFGHPQRLLPYLKKRFLRVYPVYLIVLLSVYLAARSVPALSDTVPHDPAVLLKTLLLLPQDRAVVGGTGAPILIVAWSMQYEIAFYAILACFIWSRVAGLAVVVLLIANYATCHIGQSCSFPRSFFASHFILPFFFGVLIELLSRSKIQLNHPLRVAAAAGSVLALLRGLDITFGLKTLTDEGVIIYGLPSAVLIFSLVRAEEGGLIRVPRYWQVLGASSYLLYLVHFPLISLFTKVSKAIGIETFFEVAMAFTVAFCLCIAVAVIGHLTVERPLIAFLLNRLQPVVGKTVATEMRRT